MVTRNSKDFIYYATRLGDILQAHIRQEEREIFPLVDSTLSPSQDERVACEMKSYDAAWQDRQLAIQLRHLADLEWKYLNDGLETNSREARQTGHGIL
jgi:hemerythrin-like domain-containing protein